MEKSGKDVTLSTRVSSELAAQVDFLSEQYNRSRSWLLQEAMQHFVHSEMQFMAAVEEGREAYRRGEVVAHEDVVAAWQRRETKTPVIVWTEPAFTDLEEAWNYLTEEFSPAMADRIGDRMLKQVDRLLLFPSQGRLGRVAGTRELVFSDLPYVAIYEIHGTEIAIKRMMHTARLWPPVKQKTDEE